MTGDETLAERWLALHDELTRRVDAGEFEAVGGRARELMALVTALRERGPVDVSLRASEQALALVEGLARHDPIRSLPALARATEELGRCCQRAEQFERAAAAYAQNVEALRLLTAGAVADRARLELALADAMSNHALALAQAGQLDAAYERAGAFVERARRLLPRALPSLSGGLVFLADLADDLGRPSEARDHLAQALRLLDDAAGQGLPGAAGAAGRVADRLREAIADQIDADLDADVRERLARHSVVT